MSIIQGVGSDEVSAGFYPFSINQSLIFNSGDSAFLSRTTGSATNTFTFSTWLKRGNISAGEYQYIFSSGASGLAIGKSSGGVLEDRFYVHDGSSNQEADPLIRDPSSWYHVVLSANSGTGVLYINGESVKTGISVASLSTGSGLTRIGRFGDGNFYLDGYLAETHLVTGSALTPTSFGETKNDIWVPKVYSGSYGNDGFQLTYADSSDIGNDSSGENHDLTPSGFQTDDVVNDSPTNNHATMNPLAQTNCTLSDGNLKVVTPNNAGKALATIPFPSSGKWFVEVTFSAKSSVDTAMIGIVPVTDSTDTFIHQTGGGYAYFASNGNLYHNGSNSAYGATFTVGDVITVAFDSDSGTLTFFKNGTTQGTAVTGLTDEFVLALSDGSNTHNVTYTVNFGQQSFAHPTAASGHVALNTANLPDPAIDPNDDETPDQYMDTVVYTPNDGTLSVTGLEFQPDWVWIKDRNNNIAHAWFDVLRGTAPAGASDNKALGSSRPDAEGNTNGVLSSFDSGGFTVAGGSSTSNPRVLVNKGTTANGYVAWCWKAGGSGSSVSVDSISAGVPSIASTVSASTESGFSLVKWTATGSVGTVAHGLSKKPEMIIYKSIDVSVNWIIGHAGNPNGFSDRLQFTNGAVSSNNSDAFNSTEPTNQVMTIGSFSNTNNKDHIAYVFHSVDGFSKFGHYIGKGTIGDTFVFTGFRPAFVMIKSNNSSTDWSIFDRARNTFNEADKVLEANDPDDEFSNSNGPDLLSNGFKVRGNVGNWNHNDERYIYMAFAQQPFKYANAR